MIIILLNITGIKIPTSNASIKWDVSEFENGGIIAWLEDNKTTLYIGSKTVIYSNNLAYYFVGGVKVTLTVVFFAQSSAV